jgi:hypothetical protein
VGEWASRIAHQGKAPLWPQPINTRSGEPKLTQQLEDKWLGGPSGSPRYTPKQRRDMINMSVQRNGHVGCNCEGCPVHPGQKCFLWTLPEGVNLFKVLTPQHLAKGPGDHHLSNVDAFCGPCNKNAEQLYAQHTIPHTHTHSDAAETLAVLEARREEIRQDPTTSSGKLLNLDHEVDYRRFMFQFVKEGRRYTRSQANASARELSDSGRDAAYGYASRLFSDVGPLTDLHPVTKKKDLVRFKEPGDYKLTLEELEARYPKEGRQK